jgi:hypothetical protein
VLLVAELSLVVVVPWVEEVRLVGEARLEEVEVEVAHPHPDLEESVQR